jgi:glycosyltransferase involved in cell wall biosynthesis
VEHSRVVVVMPALDEEAAIGAVLDELPAGVVDQVVVCDNGSRDRTAEVARGLGAFVVAEPRRGYGRACQTALDVIRGSRGDLPGAPYGPRDVVVFLDADHSDFPADLPLVIEPLLADQADLVIGSRIMGGATMKALLPQAWFGNRLACLLMRVLFGIRATDLGPFRALRLGTLDRLGMVDESFGWTVEMQLKAHVAGLRVREVGVRYRARIGVSKITGTVGGTLRAGGKILGWVIGWRVRLWLGPNGTGRGNGEVAPSQEVR